MSITPEEIVDGRRISLAVALQSDGTQLGTIPGRINPLRTMHTINGSLDPDPDAERVLEMEETEYGLEEQEQEEEGDDWKRELEALQRGFGVGREVRENEQL